MNARKIKMALTLGLINRNTRKIEPMTAIRQVMRNASEAGAFVGLLVRNRRKIDDNNESAIVEMQYENCKLNVNMIMNQETQSQFINDINVEEREVE